MIRVDFPIYFIESISERHIVIAGGGGASRTGVHNQINVFELIPTKESCDFELVMKYQLPKEIPDAIMCGSMMKGDLATGCNNTAVIYNLKFEVDRCCYSVSNFQILKSPQVKAEIKCIKYVSGNCLLSGSVDGRLTVWSLGKNPGDIGVKKSFKAHSKEIDEIDINPFSEQITTLSRGEGRLVFWSSSDYQMIKEFKKDAINDKSDSQNSNMIYNYRSCRFAYDATTSGVSDSCLLVACNPTQSKAPSMIYKWAAKDANFNKLGCKFITLDGIMAIDVSKDGRYVAIGSRSGEVAMFEVRYLKQIYVFRNAHQNAVTGLEFLPPKQESLVLTNSQLNPFLSVSIDRKVVLHKPGRRSLIFKFIMMLLYALMLFLAYVFVQNYFINDTSILLSNGTSPSTTMEHENNSIKSST